MKRKKIISILIALVIVASIGSSFSACGNQENSSNEEMEPSTVISKEDIELKKKAEKMNKEEENFYGTWVATSSQAEYLYGNLEITINEDGTFTGNVTQEDFSGTWEKTASGIKFTSEVLSGELFFGNKCKMVIHDEYDTKVTLKKQ